MPFKGHAKIVLMDAETMEVTDVVESDNIVTNFWDVMVNNNLQRLVRVGGGVGSMFNYTDFISDVFGGVMVFSKPLDQSESHVFPTYEEAETMIGCANQDTSLVSSTFKGAINAAGTVITEDYATFAWDFNTTQCNGAIACICLTSHRGGELGCRFNAKYDGYRAKNSMFNPLGGNTWGRGDSSVSAATNANALIDISVTGRSGDTCMWETESAVYFRGESHASSLRKPKYYKDTSMPFTGNTATKKFRTEQTTVDRLQGYRVCYCTDKTKAAMIKMSGDSLEVLVFSGDSFVPVQHNVPLTNMLTSVREFLNNSGSFSVDVFRGFIGDAFVVVYGDLNGSGVNGKQNTLRCYILKLDGTFTYSDTTYDNVTANTLGGGGTISGVVPGVSWGTVGLLVPIAGELFLRLNRERYGNCAVHVDRVTGELSQYPHYSFAADPQGMVSYETDNEVCEAPFFTCSGVGATWTNNVTKEGIAFMPNYLATINNVDAVVTKTPDKFMQIVYTIERVDE